MKLDEFELTRIINTVEKAVTNSWAGEVYAYGGTPEQPQKRVNQVSFQLYMSVLIAVINKMENVEIVHSEHSPLDETDIIS